MLFYRVAQEMAPLRVAFEPAKRDQTVEARDVVLDNTCYQEERMTRTTAHPNSKLLSNDRPPEALFLHGLGYRQFEGRFFCAIYVVKFFFC